MVSKMHGAKVKMIMWNWFVHEDLTAVISAESVMSSAGGTIVAVSRVLRCISRIFL